MSKSKKKQQNKGLRNPMALSPLLKKGGRHEKSNKAKRRKDKVAFKKEWGVDMGSSVPCPHSI